MYYLCTYKWFNIYYFWNRGMYISSRNGTKFKTTITFTILEFTFPEITFFVGGIGIFSLHLRQKFESYYLTSLTHVLSKQESVYFDIFSFDVLR